MPTVVVTETISTHYIDASGNTWNVEVSYGPEAGIPSGAQLSVSELTGDEADAYAARAAEALNVASGQLAYAKALDIAIVKDGAEVTPDTPVSVSIRLLDAPQVDDNTNVNVLHFGKEVESVSCALNGEKVEFEADGFSVYVVTFTLNSETFNYNYDTTVGTSIALTDILEALETTVDNIQTVNASNPDALKVEQKGDAWMITPLTSFEHVTLTITPVTGEKIEVSVRSAAKPELTITANSDSKVYDGEALTNNGYTSEGLAEGDQIESVTVTVEKNDGSGNTEERKDVGTSANVPSNAKIVNANTGEDVTANYTISYVNGTLTVERCEVTVRIVGENAANSYDSKEHSVNGYTATAYYKSDGENETECDFYNVDGNISFTGTASAARTNVVEGEDTDGQTDMGLAADQFGNTDPNFTVTFDVTDGYQKIEPINATVTITGHNNTVDYDGTKHTIIGYDVTVDNDLYKENDFTFSGTAEASRTHVVEGGDSDGQTDMGLAAEQFTNTNPNFSTVTFNVTDGYQKINPIPVTVTVTGHNSTSNYDGASHSVTGYDTTAYSSYDEQSQSGTASELYDVDNDIEFTGSADATRTDVGTSYMGLAKKFKNTNPDFNPVTFIVTDGYQTIKPITAVVTITGHNNTTAYDGEPHTVSGYDVSIDNPLYKQTDFTFNGTASATRTNIVEGEDTDGKTDMGLAEDQFDNTNSNFSTVTFNVTDGYQKITPIGEVTVTITGHSDTAVYNGDAHTVSGYDVAFSNELYTENDFTFSGTAEATRTHVVEGDDTDGQTDMGLVAGQFANTNRNFTTVTFNVTDGYQKINRKALTITADSAKKIYDGTPLTKNSYTNTELAEGDSFVENSVQTEGSQTTHGSSLNVIKNENVAIKNRIEQTVTGDYDITYINGTLEVTQKTVTITANSETKEYDGTPLTKAGYTNTALAEGDTIETVSVSGSQTVAGTVENVPSGAVIKNADNEDVTASYDIDYQSGTLEVTQKPLTITANSDTKEYDGTPLKKEGYTTGTGESIDTGIVGDPNLAVGDHIESVAVNGSQTVAGSNPNKPSGAVIKNADDVDVTASYDINYVDGTLTVTKKPVTITADSAERAYDGTALEKNNYKVTEGNLAKDDIIASLTVTGSRTKAGISDNVPSDALIRNASNEDVTASYEITYKNGTLEVTPKTLTITADSAQKVYDGTPLMKDGYKVTEGSLAEGDTIESVTVIGSQTTVNTETEINNNVPSKAKIVNAMGEDVTASYAITYAEGTLTVTQKLLTITANSDEKVYDGTPLTKNSYTNTALAEGDAIESVTVTGSQTTVNTETEIDNNVPSDAKIVNAKGEDVTASYAITYKKGTLTVTQKPLTITADSDTAQYNGTEPLTKNSYTNTALAEGDTIESVAVNGSRTVVGTSKNVPSAAVIKNAAGEDVTASYEITYKNGTLEVIKRSITITAASAEKQYDGEALTNNGITCTPSLGEEDSFFAVTVEGSQTEAGQSDNVASNAMIQNAIGEDATEQYDITYVNGTLTVTKAPVTVQITGNIETKTYNGTEQSVDGYATPIITGGNGKYTEDKFRFNGTADASGVDAGEYPMGLAKDQFENLDAKNFDVAFVVTDGKLIINPIDDTVTVTITGDQNTAEYDGDEHSVSEYSFASDNTLYGEDCFKYKGEHEPEATRTHVVEGTDGDGKTEMGLSGDSFGNISPNFTNVVFNVIDGYQEITPKPNVKVTITGNKDSADYDRTEHTVSGYEAEADSDLYNTDPGDDCDFKFNGSAVASGTDAKTYPMGLKPGQFENINPDFVDVVFDVTDGELVIYPISITVSIIGHTSTETYDGTEKTVSGYDVEPEEGSGYTVDDFTFSGSGEIKKTNAGEYEMGLLPTQFINKNYNYATVDFDVTDGSLIINPRDVNVFITGNTETFKYVANTEREVSGYTARAIDPTTEAIDPLYDTTRDFRYNGSATVKETNAGYYEMGLDANNFENTNPNYNAYFEVVEDGSLTINPIVIVRKTLNNVLRTEPEEFPFILTLLDDEDNPVSGIPLADGLEPTDTDGKTGFSLKVAHDQTSTQELVVPLEHTITVTEDKSRDTENYQTTINGKSAMDEDGNASETLSTLTDSETELDFLNKKSAICRINGTDFQSIASAVAYAESEEPEAVIEMLVNYNMPVADKVVIPANCNITLATAPDFEGEGEAVITRTEGFTGPMFTNHGILNIGNPAPGERGIILDGNGENVDATSAIITGNGTVNVYDGGTIRNAKNTAESGNGGAINSTGEVNVLGGSVSGNRAANGGAIYSTGNVTVSGGEIRGNNATSGGAIYTTNEGNVTINGEGAISGNSAANGGGVYIETGTMAVSGGTMSGNSATQLGGAIYNAGGTVNVSNGLIGREESTEDNAGDANRAVNGAAIYVGAGTSSFSGGRIIGKIATGAAGGAIGVPSDESTTVKLNFSGNAYIYNNTQDTVKEGVTSSVASNVCLTADTDTVINALSLNDYENSDAADDDDIAPRIGVYVPGEITDPLFVHRGLSKGVFGGCNRETNIGAFRNDRSTNMMVSLKNFKLVWGKSLKVELRYLANFSGTRMPPIAYDSSLSLPREGEDEYYPAGQENYIADLAADVLNTYQDHGIPSDAAFACGYVVGHADQFSDYITKIVWDSKKGDWGAERKNPDGPNKDTIDNVESIILYFSLPAYITIINNADLSTDNSTGSPLTINGLTVNGFDAASDDYLGYGLVVAKNGATVAHFEPLKRENLTMEAGTSYNILFPGARNTAYLLNGQYVNRTLTSDIEYENIYNGGSQTDVHYSAAEARYGFDTSGTTFNSDDPVSIRYGGSDNICKIVDSNGTEHYYTSLAGAVADAEKADNYDTYCVGGVVTIQMLKDYLIPASDNPVIHNGKHFKLTTVAQGYEPAEEYDPPEKAKSTHDCSNAAKISRAQGNGNSFITVLGDKVDHSDMSPATSLVIENIRFDGKQASSSNGGVLKARNCEVTIKNIECMNFSAEDGGAFFVGISLSEDGNKGYGDSSILTVEDSWFSNCKATGANGHGGGAIWTSAWSFTLNNTVFEDCIGMIPDVEHDTRDEGKKATQGGAVFQMVKGNNARRANTTATISDSDFLRCQAYGAGGGMELDAWKVTMTDCHFDQCHVLTKESGKGGGAFNVYVEQGSGLSKTDGSLEITGCTFTGCTSSQQGGAFRTKGGLPGGGTFNVTLTKTTFDGNTAGDKGGAMWLNLTGTKLTLDGCTFTRNRAVNQGGAIHTIYPTTICGHTTITDNELTSNTATNGAAIYYNSSLTLGKTEFKEGEDRKNCDVIIIKDNIAQSGSNSQASNLWISQMPLVANDLGGTYTDVNSGETVHGEIHVSNATNPNAASGTQFAKETEGHRFTGLSDLNHVFVSDVNPELWGVASRSNKVNIVWSSKPVCKITDAAGDLLYFDQYGQDPAVFGLLDNKDHNTADNAPFSYLRRTKANVVLYYKGDNTLPGSRYTDNTFCIKMLQDYTVENYITTNTSFSGLDIILTTAGKDKEAEDGFHYRDEGERATLYRGSGLGAGNLLTAKTNITLTNIVLDGNGYIQTQNTNSGGGGLIMMKDGGSQKLVLGKDAVLQNGQTSVSGGAISINTGTFVVKEGSVIKDCKADNNGGGAIYVNGGALKIEGGTITCCTAKNGGAVYLNNGSFEMTGGTIGGSDKDKCTATENGGGVFIANNKTMTMSGGEITHNNAGSGKAGGGIAVGGTGARLYFSGDVTVDNNTKGTGTSAIPCNVELNQDTDQVIQTTGNGLGRDALIGVYTTLTNRDTEGDDFGTRPDDTGNGTLRLFVNDRNGLRGRATTNNKIEWAAEPTLIVTKTVSSPLAGDLLNQEFKFKVTLKDKTTHHVREDISGRYGVGTGRNSLLFTDGVSEEFTLRNGEYRNVANLPNDVEFEVEEIGSINEDGTLNPDYGFNPTPLGKITATSVAGSQIYTAAFTNTRKTGNLTVIKYVDKAEDAASIIFNYTVELSEKLSGTYGGMTFTDGKATFTLQGKEITGAPASSVDSTNSKTATGLPTGITYTVTEAVDSRFNTETKVNGDARAPIRVPMRSEAAGDNTVVFTNIRRVGGLKVTKASVTSDISADHTREYEFMVKLEKDGALYNGTCGASKLDENDDPIVDDQGKPVVTSITFTEGLATFKLTVGQSMRIIDMPQGWTYTVRENAPNFTVRSSPSNTTGVIKDAEIGYSFANTRQTGRLTIQKKLDTERDADKNEKFGFELKLGHKNGDTFEVDTGITKSYSSVSFTEGVATVTLTGASAKTIAGLPRDIDCQVTEKNRTHFTLSGVTINDSPATVVDYAVVATIGATEKVIAFTNQREKGGLTVTKTVVSDLAEDADKVFNFTVTLGDKTIGKVTGGKVYGNMTFVNGVATFTLKDGESAMATGLPTDVRYTVTESQVSGFTTQSTGASGSIGDTAYMSTAVFTNERRKGDLTVTNTVSSEIATDVNKEFDFTVTLNDTTIGKVTEENPNGKTYGGMTFKNGVATFKLKGKEGENTVTATGLPAGVGYTVTQDDKAYFTKKNSGTTGTITANKAYTASFTNTRQTGKLAIQKGLVSDLAEDHTGYVFKIELKEDGKPAQWDKTLSVSGQNIVFTDGVAENVTVTVPGNSDNKTLTLSGLPAGLDYTVTETVPDGFETPVKTNDVGKINTATSTATFTNTRKKGNLTISKILVSDLAADANEDFTFKVTLTDKKISKSYDYSHVVDGETVTVKGGVSFEKGVASFTLKGGESRTILGLPVSVGYTVAETANSNFTTTCNNGTVDPETQEPVWESGNSVSGRVGETTSEAKFTNTRKTGELNVSKTLVSDLAVDTDQEFEFTVTLIGLKEEAKDNKYGNVQFTNGESEKIKLKGGEKRTITGLPTGVQYTVTETSVDGFTTTKTGDTGTISTTLSEAAFTNTRQTGDLKVSKTLVSDRAADADREFEFTVTLDGLNGEAKDKKYGGVQFTNGESEKIKLKGGQDRTITGLPTGVTYTVEETSADGFTTEKTGDTGTVSITLSEAAFTNTRKKGSLTVQKFIDLENALPSDSDKKFTFTVQVEGLSDAAKDRTYGDVKFTGGVATVELSANDDPKRITGLPTDVVYTVTETADPDFTATRNGGELDQETQQPVWTDGNSVSGTVSDAPSEARFTNKHRTGELQVSKAVESPLASDANREFTFTVTVAHYDSDGKIISDDGIEGTYGGLSFTPVLDENERPTGESKSEAFTLKHGEGKTITGLPTGVTYTVEEAPVDGFTTAKTGDTGTVSTTLSEAAFTNTRKTGSLQVSKEVVSDRATDAKQNFTFTVTLAHYDNDGQIITDDFISGTYGGLTFTPVNGENNVSTGESRSQEFTLKGGEHKIITGLPTGVKYTVAEARADDMTTEVMGANGEYTTPTPVLDDDQETVIGYSVDGDIASDQPSQETFRNTRETGKLMVSKTLESDRYGDADREFSFTVKVMGLTSSVLEKEGQVGKPYTLNDQAGNAIKGGLTFNGDGEATITLKHGESKTIEGLPIGVNYIVSENLPEDFKLKTSSGVTGTINATPSEAEFTNEVKRGNLMIAKKVDSALASDKAREYTFTVAVTGLDASVFRKEGQEGKVYTLKDQDNNSIQGGLTFTPVLDENEQPTDQGKATLKMQGGQSRTIVGLPTGVTYTVTEDRVDDMTTEVMGANGGYTTPTPVLDEDQETVTGYSVDGEIISDQTSEEEYKNTREVHNLILKKMLVGSPIKAELNNAYKLRITLSNGNNASDFSGVKYYNSVRYASDADTRGTASTVKFENGVGTVDLKNGARESIALPIGIEFKVEEIWYRDTWGSVNYGQWFDTTFVGDQGVTVITPDNTTEPAPQNGEIEIGEGGGETEPQNDLTVTETYAEGTIGQQDTLVTVTNTRNTGDLVLKRTVDSNTEGDKDKEVTFEIHLTGVSILRGTYGDMTFDSNGKATLKLKHGDSKTATGLPYGAQYTVKELITRADGFETTATRQENNETAQNAPLKEDPDVNNSSKAPKGMITENAYVLNQKENKVVFTNTRVTGDLTVSKILDSDRAEDANQDFAFTVKLSDDTINQQYDIGNGKTLTFANGVASFTLKGGESITIKYLPENIGYTVTETANSSFTTTWNDGTADGESNPVWTDGNSVQGKISSSPLKTNEAKFTNTRKPGDLKISKVLKKSLKTDAERPFRFTVTVTGLALDEQGKKTFILKKGDQEVDGGITFERPVGGNAPDNQSVATVDIKGGETWTIVGLPTGVTYTVAETAMIHDGSVDDRVMNSFTTTITTNGRTAASVVNRTVVAGDNNRHVFTNTRKVSNLVVTKSVESNLAADRTRGFAFKVTLDDPTIIGTYGDMVFSVVNNEDGDPVQSAATFNLKASNAPTITARNLPVGVGYKVEETWPEVTEPNESDAKWYDTSYVVKDVDVTNNEQQTDSTAGNDWYTLKVDKTAQVTAVNARKTRYVKISKAVVSERAGDEDHLFSFTVTVNGFTANGQTRKNYKLLDNHGNEIEGGLNFNASGVSEAFTMKHGDSRTIVGLPAGAKITVKENAGIKPLVQGESGLEETGDFKVSQLYVTTGQYKDESEDAPSPVVFNGASVTIDSLPVPATPDEPAAGDEPVNNPPVENDPPAESVPKPFVIHFINSAAVCKITVNGGNNNGVLLYEDEKWTIPAVYSALDNTVTGKLMNSFYRNGSKTPYTGDLAIKMLVPEYTVSAPLNLTDAENPGVGIGKNILLTTAGKSDSQYPYTGTNDKASVKRGFENEGSLIESDMGDKTLTVSNIVLDGNTMANDQNGGIIHVHSGILNIAPGAELTRGNAANGGAVYVANNATAQMTGGEITGNSAVNGGGVYVVSGGKVTLKDGTKPASATEAPHATINGNTATTAGAGIYLAQGAKLNLEGSPNFGGTGTADSTGKDPTAAISGPTPPEGVSTNGNYLTGNLASKTNGQKPYTKARQDIYLNGYESVDAASIVVTGKINSAPGSIWVWADTDLHAKMLNQFAMLSEELLNSGKTAINIAKITQAELDATYLVFRNAQDDVTTECGGDYLTGQEGDSINLIKWTGGFDFVFKKIDGEGNALNGATFTLYMSVKDDSGNYVPMTDTTSGEMVAYQQTDKKNGGKKDATATSGSGTQTDPLAGTDADHAVAIKVNTGTDAEPVIANPDPKVYGEGLAVFEKIPPGVYFIKETTPLTVTVEGKTTTYVPVEDMYMIDLNGKGYYTITKVEVGEDSDKKPTYTNKGVAPTETLSFGTGESAYTVDVALAINVDARTRKVILKKVDGADYKPLDGAKFTVYYADMQTVVKVDGKNDSGEAIKVPLEDLTSGAGGAYFIGKLPFGTYYMEEKTSPNGYTKPTKYFQFKVDENGVSKMVETAWTPTNTLNANGPDIPAS